MLCVAALLAEQLVAAVGLHHVVAVCCSVLQCIAVCCRVMQGDAVSCRVLQ